MQADPPRVCFVALNAWGALTGAVSRHVGGIERQQAQLARALASMGWSVGLITWDEGQPDGTVVDGVHVYKTCPPAAGMRGLRFVHPRWTSLWGALERFGPDVCYYNCGDCGLGQVALWCRVNGRACLYSVASDPDCEWTLPVLRQKHERLLYRFGLRRATRIICQSKRQCEMLAGGFRLTSTVVPMPCLLDVSRENRNAPDGCQRPRVLWVGRVSPEKRPEMLLSLAARRPEWDFDLVGASNRSDQYGEQIAEMARPLSNVTLHGRVAPADITDYYRAASVLCCTSQYEGFPNTFLEAWSQGLPVISTVDPDGVIERNGLGRIAPTMADMDRHVAEVLNSPHTWTRMSVAGRRYVNERHTLPAVLPHIMHIIRSAAAEHRRVSGPRIATVHPVRCGGGQQ